MFTRCGEWHPWPVDMAPLGRLGIRLLTLECIYDDLTEEMMAMKKPSSGWNFAFPVHFGHQSLTCFLFFVFLDKFKEFVKTPRLLNIVGPFL